MKKLDAFFNGLTKWHGYAIVLNTIIVLLLAKFELLETKITVQYWQLALMISFPHLLFFLLRLVWLRQKRIYKMGDFVNILADERKFMIVRYENWYPLHAVCKQVGSSDALSLHQKYLEPWVEIPDTSFGLNAILGKRNINNVVPTVKITRL